MLVHILVVVRPTERLARVTRALSESDTLVTGIENPDDLWERLGAGTWDLVVLSRNGVAVPANLVEEIRQLPDRPDVIVLSDRESAEERAALLSAGCLAVVAGDLDDTRLEYTLHALVQRRREQSVGRLRVTPASGQFRLSNLVSSSPTMQRFLSVARRVVATDSTLLILGETGVGKEWLARAVHAEGPRAAGPFVAVSCAALSESLLESELFGHERGAFTGATRSRRGYFEIAHGGTIFLDEIGELPLHLQVKLLRVLEERRIQPVGAEKAIDVDVRVMAATNRDLEVDVREKRFRADLYYRLNVVSLTLPPLRERREDIPALVAWYVEDFAIRLRQTRIAIHPEALEALTGYAWPGNVRELINVIERAVLMCHGGRILASDLPEGIRSGTRPYLPELPELAGGAEGRDAGGDWLDQPWPLARRRLLAAAELRYLERLLDDCGGRVGEAAARAGINPRSLFEKMRHYGLRKEDFRRRARVREARMRPLTPVGGREAGVADPDLGQRADPRRPL